jgi:hypothetical protein
VWIWHCSPINAPSTSNRPSSPLQVYENLYLPGVDRVLAAIKSTVSF